MRSFGRLTGVVVAMVVLSSPQVATQSAEGNYTQTLAREEVLRKDLDSQGSGQSAPLLSRIRMLVGEYEALVHRFPRSGYSDNALYQGALLSADAFWQFGEESDRRAAIRLFKTLRSEYPSSSLNRQTATHTQRLDAAARAAVATPAPATAATGDERAVLKAIRREVLPDALRVTLELEREAPFREERLEGPPRVFVDLQNTRAVADLRDATLAFPDDVVRKVRVGRQQGATRVVLDLEGAARHSVYALYNPYRIVVDFERPTVVAKETRPEPAPATSNADNRKEEPGATWTADQAPATPPAPVAPPPRETEAAPAGDSSGAPSGAKDAPKAPVSNSRGGFSLSRQLGLGISRVVIDAGHGGHDPGAHVKGLNEADLTLDVALRLEKLLLKEPGVEVVMTRRTNVYIPLEERTAIANRAGADLFLSIHANASRSVNARGIETYFLNFAPNPEAEAVAARENAGSSKTMHHLPDIVKAIALNNKLDESRDFASLVQTAMVDRLRKVNRNARSLGVKQAPFMVLIGATMPSVLSEISFVTNRQEATLLKTVNYRQAIAEALFDGVSNNQKSLKAAQTVAAQ